MLNSITAKESRKGLNSRALRPLRAGWPYALLVAVLLTGYANTFNASWQYDDFGNIVNNPRVHMTELSLVSVHEALTPFQKHQVLSRPLAYLSFALNYRAGGLDVFGYHVVNFIVHCLAAGFLFLFLKKLLSLPLLSRHYGQGATAIAWTAVFLWACHPIQITAVTFIVQRMAAMAGMFYAAALYCYLLGRTTEKPKQRWSAYTCCLGCGLAALLSKENAVVLPAALVLLEYCFFRPAGGYRTRQILIVIVGPILVFVLALVLFTEPAALFRPFENRPFSMGERLLTQPRVLFHYLSLILVPMAARFSIVHDIAVSRDLFTPWTTLPALAAVVFIVLVLAVAARRYPLTAFCGLFFFLNHAVESSFLNLELIYEHRNYIPTMMLFVPAAAGLHKSLLYFRTVPWLRGAIAVTAGLVFISMLHTTYLYNDIFRTEGALWAHVVYRYPRLSIGYNYLSQAYWSLGEYEKAAEMSYKAIALDRYNARHQKALGYYNLALYEAYHRDNLSAAQDHLQRAMNLNDDYFPLWRELGKILVLRESYEEAELVLRQALEKYPGNIALEYLMGIACLRRNQCSEAKSYAESILAKDPGQSHAKMLLAQSVVCTGDAQKAVQVWETVALTAERTFDKMLALTALIELTAREKEVDRPSAMWVESLLGLLKANQRTATAIEIKKDKTLVLPYWPDMQLINNVVQGARG